MDSLELPNYIDVNDAVTTDIASLTMFHQEPNKPKDLVDDSTGEYMGEYMEDINNLLIKSTVLNILYTLQDVCENDNPSDSYTLMNVLKNMLIIHGKAIYNMRQSTQKFVDILENVVVAVLPLDYNRFIIHTMINNIRHNKLYNNLHFREINKVISNLPPISAEDRIVIENKLPMFRYSKQIKKTPNPFKVDQIVGAKDKENKWWLARILHVYSTPNSPYYWYYVYFEGWGHAHNEWINSKTFRVRYYNPRKHFLKKP